MVTRIFQSSRVHENVRAAHILGLEHGVMVCVVLVINKLAIVISVVVYVFWQHVILVTHKKYISQPISWQYVVLLGGELLQCSVCSFIWLRACIVSVSILERIS